MWNFCREENLHFASWMMMMMMIMMMMMRRRRRRRAQHLPRHVTTIPTVTHTNSCTSLTPKIHYFSSTLTAKTLCAKPLSLVVKNLPSLARVSPRGNKWKEEMAAAASFAVLTIRSGKENLWTDPPSPLTYFYGQSQVFSFFFFLPNHQLWYAKKNGSSVGMCTRCIRF